jgi:hypothetical protein
MGEGSRSGRTEMESDVSYFCLRAAKEKAAALRAAHRKSVCLIETWPSLGDLL